MEYLQAGAAGEHDIADDNVKLSFAHKRFNQGAVVEHGAGEVIALERVAEQPTQVGLVVDDEHLRC